MDKFYSPEQEEEDKKYIEKEFKNNTTNLENDVDHIDNRINDINNHAINLENNINRIEASIKKIKATNQQNQNDQLLAKLYGNLNKSMEHLSLFQKNITDLLTLKQKYRKEQDDLRLNIHKLIIEKRKVFKESDKLSSNELVTALKSFEKSLDGDNNKSNKEVSPYLEEIDDFENDPDYKI